MLRRLALVGDVSGSIWHAEERLGRREDPVNETKWEVGYGVKVDIRRRFDTGESCVASVGIKPPSVASNLSFTRE